MYNCKYDMMHNQAYKASASDAWEFYGIFSKLTDEEKKIIFRIDNCFCIDDIIAKFTPEGAMRRYYTWKAYHEKGIKKGTIVEIINTEDSGIVLDFEGDSLVVYGNFDLGSIFRFKLDEVDNLSKKIDYEVDFRSIFDKFE